MLGSLAVAAAAQGTSEPTEIVIKVSEPWVDTGFDVSTTSPVRIFAKGIIDVSLPSRRLFTPNGDATCEGSLGTPLLAPGLPCWSLIGRVGKDGSPFFVGSSSTLIGEDVGRLYLSVNDETSYFADNYGQWTATITIGGEMTGVPGPADLFENPKVYAGLKEAFQGTRGSTILARISAKDEWKSDQPETRDTELSTISDSISTLSAAGGESAAESRQVSARDREALRQTVKSSLAALLGRDRGKVSRAFFGRSLLEALDDGPADSDSLRAMQHFLNKAATDGLTADVKPMLSGGKYAAFVAAACAKPATAIRLRGIDDLLILRYRAIENAAYVYDLYATWKEECAPGQQATAYADVKIKNGDQGYARHEIAVTLDANGIPQLKPRPSPVLYSVDSDGLWRRGMVAAVK
jgi:hypothetical protein